MMIQPIYIFLLVALVVSVTIAMLVLPNILLISHKKKLFDMRIRERCIMRRFRDWAVFRSSQ